VPLSQLSAQTVSTEAEPLRLLIVSESRDLPAAVRELIVSRGIEVEYVDSCRQACEAALLSGVDAVLLYDCTVEGFRGSASGEIQLLADALISHRLTGVVLSSGTAGVVPDDSDAFVAVSDDLSAEELWGRVATIRKYRPLLRRMEDQVSVMQRLGKKLNQHLVEVDQELRLASRLQRDFLPKSFPEIGDIRFAALYRPASWVSGDVYDVRRLDEKHIEFFLADAVGHGVAAGLLTMFIKQAVVGKRVRGPGYIIVPPSEVLAALNNDLAAQELPNCQFVTACYATINVATHELILARGGHPHPIHVGPDGRCAEVRTVGGLLGVFPDEDFPSTTLLLEPGERLIIYSDGMEDAIISRGRRDRGGIEFTDVFLEMARLPSATCLRALADRLDRSEGSLAPRDDQTCIIVERLPV